MSWFKHKPKPKEGVSYHPNRNTPIGRELKEQTKDDKNEKKDVKDGPTNTHGRC